jgi:hypothetical protein
LHPLLLAGLMLAPAVCRGQPIAENLIQISSFTNVALGSGALPGTADSRVSSLAFDIEATYYVTPKVGIGGIFSYQRFVLEGSGGRAQLANSYYGPTAQLRLPLDERSAFILTASAGGIRVGLHNQRADFGDALDLTGIGRFWLAGGGLSFWVTPKATIDLAARYQSSTFRSGQSTSIVSAGLFLGVGVSLYISS